MISRFLHKLRDVRSGDNPIWLTVYSDLMTNLMLFFLMLYGVSRMAPEVRAQILEGLENRFERRPSIEQKAERLVDEFKQEETETALDKMLRDSDIATLDINEQQVKITLTSPALFPSGEAALSPSLKKELLKLSKALALLSTDIRVEGHTDNVPPRSIAYKTNWELSIARANGVIDFLTTEGGLPPSRFVAAGYGEHRPVTSNTTFKGRAQNRRIEISLLKKGAPQ